MLRGGWQAKVKIKKNRPRHAEKIQRVMQRQRNTGKDPERGEKKQKHKEICCDMLRNKPADTKLGQLGHTCLKT